MILIEVSENDMIVWSLWCNDYSGGDLMIVMWWWIDGNDLLIVGY